MKLKLLSYVLFALSALTFYAMISHRSSSSLSLRGLQSTNSNDASATSSTLPLTITISGVSQLVQALVQASTFTNSTFDIISVNALSSIVNGDIIDYELALSITNDENVTIDGYIQGVYDSASGKIVFSASSYNLSAVESDSSDVSEIDESSDAENATEILLSNYTSISASQVAQDAIALAAVKYGAKNVLSNLIDEGLIPALSPSYSINPIVSAGYKNESDADYYLFSVHMINAAYINVNSTFVVSYNGNYSLDYYTYLAYNYTAAEFNMTSLPTTSTNTTSNVTSNGTVVGSADSESDSEASSNVTIGVSDDNSTNITAPANNTNSTAPSSNTTVAANATNSTGNTTTATWVALDTSKITSNAKILGALKYGAKAVLSAIINSDQIPAYYPNYSISKINSAAYENLSNGTLYKFNVSMVNAAYIHVNSTYTVAYNGNYSLANYNYSAYNYTQAEFNMTTPTTTTTTTTTANTTTTTASANSTANSTSSSNSTSSGSTTLNYSETESEAVSDDSDVTPGIELGSDTAVF